LWWKHTLYEDSVRVPLILRWPERLPRGERRAHVVDLLDVAATMIGAIEGPPLPHGHGRDLLAIARNGSADWHDEIFSEHCTDTVPAWTGGRATQQRMIRSGAWKLIYTHDCEPQLFDLASDPHERRDLAGDARHAQVRERLLARVLDGWDPEHIRTRIAERRRDKDLIGAWARSIEPSDAFRWTLLPEQNRLDKVPS